jgi:hypothetical protein
VVGPPSEKPRCIGSSATSKQTVRLYFAISTPGGFRVAIVLVTGRDARCPCLRSVDRAGEVYPGLATAFTRGRSLYPSRVRISDFTPRLAPLSLRIFFRPASPRTAIML